MPHAIPVQRQNSSQGGRLLGVRIGPDGTFNEELSYRIQQVKSMASKLACAPFDPRDVLMVYQVRYKPATTFCIPITMFTNDQCDAIQRPFYRVMLPKLRINQHMKCDGINGPRELGGLNFLGLKADQLAQHTH